MEETNSAILQSILYKHSAPCQCDCPSTKLTPLQFQLFSTCRVSSTQKNPLFDVHLADREKKKKIIHSLRDELGLELV